MMSKKLNLNESNRRIAMLIVIQQLLHSPMKMSKLMMTRLTMMPILMLWMLQLMKMTMLKW